MVTANRRESQMKGFGNNKRILKNIIINHKLGNRTVIRSVKNRIALFQNCLGCLQPKYK